MDPVSPNPEIPSKPASKRPQGCRQWWGRVLFYALTKKYDATASLLGKFVWPLATLGIVILFHPQIKSLVSHLAESVSRTSKITIAGVEVQISQGNLNPKDKGAYAIIGLLNRDDLLLILELGESTHYSSSKSDHFKKKIKPILNRLKEYGLASIKEKVTPPPGVNADLTYELTGLGKRVYEELKSLLLGIVEKLPAKKITN